MTRKSEPNAQNSELDPQAHPSGARIEKMMQNSKNAAGSSTNSKGPAMAEVPTVSESVAGDRGAYGETLRPSERENEISDAEPSNSRPHFNTDEPVEGGRDEIPTSQGTPDEPHRQSPQDR